MRHINKIISAYKTSWNTVGPFTRWREKIGWHRRTAAGILKAVDLPLVPFKPGGTRLEELRVRSLITFQSEEAKKAAKIFASDRNEAENALFAPLDKWSSLDKLHVLRMIDLLAEITREHSEATFPEIMAICRRTDPSIERFVAPLMTSLREAKEFPRDNLAYQAIVWLFRMKDKTDYHCHKSLGQHPSVVAKIILGRRETKEYTQILDEVRTLAEQGTIGSETAKDFENAVARENAVELTELLMRTRELRDWNNGDFFEATVALSMEALKETARNHLRDGVTHFSIRMNPFKEKLYPEHMPAAEAFESFIKASIDALNEVAREFQVNESGLNIIISLNRTGKKERENLRRMEKVAGKLNALADRYKERILGLDLSGTEYAGSQEEHDPAQWEKIIAALPKHMKFFPHVGDIRNIYRGDHILSRKWLAYLKAKKEMSLGKDASETPETLSLLFEIIEDHLEFCRKYVEVMPKGSALAHGTVLAQRTILFLIPPEIDNLAKNRELYPFDLEGDLPADYDVSRKRLLDRFRKIKTAMLAKNIAIDFCPTTTVKSVRVEDFRALPIFQWVNADGLKIRIGVDGIWDEPEPRTLSEELTRLFITKPKIGSALSFGKILGLVN